MASNFFDTAKSVKTGAEALLDRLKSDRETLAQLLASAKAAENRLIEKEQREKREQAEKEKAERLKKFLESGESNAYVVDAADQASEAAAQNAPEPPAEPVKAEAPAVEPAPAAAAEQPAPKAQDAWVAGRRAARDDRRADPRVRAEARGRIGRVKPQQTPEPRVLRRGAVGLGAGHAKVRHLGTEPVVLQKRGAGGEHGLERTHHAAREPVCAVLNGVDGLCRHV